MKLRTKIFLFCCIIALLCATIIGSIRNSRLRLALHDAFDAQKTFNEAELKMNRARSNYDDASERLTKLSAKILSEKLTTDSPAYSAHPDYEQEYAVLVKTNAKPTSVDVTFKPTPACWAVFYEYAATTGSGKGFAWYQVALNTPDDLKQLINLVRSDVYRQNTNVVSVMIINLVKLGN